MCAVIKVNGISKKWQVVLVLSQLYKEEYGKWQSKGATWNSIPHSVFPDFAYLTLSTSQTQEQEEI